MKEKVFTILLFCSYGLKAEDVASFKEDLLNIYKHTAFSIKNETHEKITSDNVTYYLFRQDNPKHFIIVNSSNPQQLADKAVIFFYLIHGWNENKNATWYADLKNGLLSRGTNKAVVQVDWSGPANQRYAYSSYNTRHVGHIIGKLLATLHQKYKVSPENFYLIGHSLGAHVSGFAGKKFQEMTGEKLGIIVALDAAGPLFDSQPNINRLSKTDAKRVHAIHTDDGTFGRNESYGTIDFFPNGGKSQPGCKHTKFLSTGDIKATVSCDHKRSYEYFIEAVWNPRQFKARKCDNYTMYEKKKCYKEKAYMGDLTTKKTGNFYLKTNSKKPFAEKPGFFSSIGHSLLSKLF